jgi:hypothetical protein
VSVAGWDADWAAGLRRARCPRVAAPTRDATPVAALDLSESMGAIPEEEAPQPPPARRQLSPRADHKGPQPPPKKGMPKLPAKVPVLPPKVPPLARLNDALEKSAYDENPLKESFSEEKKTVLKLVVDMTSHITTEKALRQLKKIRMQSPELFLDPEAFLAALRLLEMYRFKLMIRRFIYELFGECFITHQQFRQFWDDDAGGGPDSARRVKK